jgi:hypothetical protein
MDRLLRMMSLCHLVYLSVFLLKELRLSYSDYHVSFALCGHVCDLLPSFIKSCLFTV